MVTIGAHMPSPLQHRDFRLLFAGQLISFAGSAAAPVALAFAVIGLTGSALDLGLVLAAGSIPQLIFLLVGGVWADRLPRNAIMIASNLVSAGAQATAGLLLLTGVAEVWHLAALAALRGAGSAFFYPASRGMVPLTVPPSDVQQANALLGLSRSATGIGGRVAGGILVALIGPPAGLLVDAVSYVLSSAALAAIHLTPRPPLAAHAFITDLADGWRAFTERSWVWATVAGFATLNAAEAGAFYVLGPVVADRTLGGAAGWGFVLGTQAAGFLVGGLIALRFQPTRPLAVGISAILLEVPMLVALGLAASLPLVVAAALLGGLGSSIFDVMWHTALQQHVPEDRLSRVYSYDALGSFAIIPVGQAVAGPVAVLIGLTGAFIGAGAVVAGSVGVMLSVPSIRHLHRHDVKATAEDA